MANDLDGGWHSWRSRRGVNADLLPSYLLEVKPRHNGREKDWYTWRVDEDRFPPGALDRIVYTDSVLQVRSSFVLNTTTMTEGELARSGLQATDVLKGAVPGRFDHLPLVADFVLSPSPNAQPTPSQANGQASANQPLRREKAQAPPTDGAPR